MKIISTKVHGIMDYIMGVILIASPWLFGFAMGGAETWIPVILGITTIIYSLFTDYELSASRNISMKTHLGLDTVSAIFLAASPWLFGFADFVFWPHLILGLLELGAVAMTETNAEFVEHSESADDEHKAEVQQNSASAYRREQKVDREQRAAPSSQTRVSPQTTASTQMHAKERNDGHRSGIHHEGKRAAEPNSNMDDLKNNEGQISHSNINRPQTNPDQDNRVDRPRESHKNRKPANVENSWRKDDNKNNGETDADKPNSKSSETKPNLSSKTEDPTNPNKSESNKRE